MRTRIIVFSLVSSVVIVLLASLLNALSGLPLDIAPAYNDPVRVVLTLIGAAPGFSLGLVGIGFALYDAARRSGAGWFIGLLVWPFVPLLASNLMFAGVLAYATQWFLALAFVPLAALMYGIAAQPSAPPAGATAPMPASQSRLVVFVSVLVLVALGGALLLTGPRGSTSVPPGPPVLQVTQNGATANCASGAYPTVTLLNRGGQALTWKANTQNPNVTATPSSGTLAPGASVTVSLSGATNAPDVIIRFQASDQTTAVAKFGCQSGASK